MREVINGKRVNRIEWNNDDIYCQLRDGYLCIHLETMEFKSWIINDGDLLATDWVVLPDIN